MNSKVEKEAVDDKSNSMKNIIYIYFRLLSQKLRKVPHVYTDGRMSVHPGIAESTQPVTLIIYTSIYVLYRYMLIYYRVSNVFFLGVTNIGKNLIYPVQAITSKYFS